MSSETDWTLYADNESAWNAMLADCAKAKESISLEQFIFVNDDFGKRLIDICAKRASEGVEVRFLWDAAGSFSLWGSNMTHKLASKGIKLLFWKTLIPSYFTLPNIRSWFLRNHRRTLVIDSKVGYTGSICVSDNMVNWRDTNLRVTGTPAKQMENSFSRMWDRAASNRPLPKKLKYRDNDFRYVTNYPSPGRRHVYSAFQKAIKMARESVYITTPYFVPTRRLIRHLRSAAKRGVDVRIILPKKSDHYFVDLGARSYFTTLLESGVRIFLYEGNMIHSKTVTVDDTWASVGSMNWDRISLLYNFEANIVSTNDAFARRVADHFRRDMQDCHEVTLPEWRKRFFAEKVPELLVKVIRKFL